MHAPSTINSSPALVCNWHMRRLRLLGTLSSDAVDILYIPYTLCPQQSHHLVARHSHVLVDYKLLEHQFKMLSSAALCSLFVARVASVWSSPVPLPVSAIPSFSRRPLSNNVRVPKYKSHQARRSKVRSFTCHQYPFASMSARPHCIVCVPHMSATHWMVDSWAGTMHAAAAPTPVCG